MVDYAGEGGESGDAEDGGAEELGTTGEEAQFVEVVRTEVVVGGEPLPLLLAICVVGLWLSFWDGLMGGSAHEVAPVLMVMVAVVAVRDNAELLLVGFLVVDELFDGPAEAARDAGIGGFDDQED